MTKHNTTPDDSVLQVFEERLRVNIESQGRDENLRDIGDIAEIRNAVFKIQFDECDNDLRRVLWRVGSSRSQYAGLDIRISGRSRKVLAHRVVLRRMLGREFEAGEMVDHINSDKRDNRRENLRLANHIINGQNRRSSWSASGFFGVSPYRGKWICRIFGKRAGKTVRLFEKPFDTKEQAAAEYNRQAEKYGYLTRNKI